MEPTLLKFLVVVPGPNGDGDVFVADSAEEDVDTAERVAEEAAAKRLDAGPWIFEGSWTVENDTDEASDLDGVWRRLTTEELSNWGTTGKVWG